MHFQKKKITHFSFTNILQTPKMYRRSTCLETAEQLEYRETHQRQKIKASLMTFTSVKIVGLLVAISYA